MSLLLRNPFPLLHSISLNFPKHQHKRCTAMMEGSKVEATDEMKKLEGKKVFVAGATGMTGKKIVDQLLSKGFQVRAGVRDVESAKSSLSSNQNIQIVKADVTEGSEKLAEAIGDAEAVICATGFRPSLDLFAPWKFLSWEDIKVSHLMLNSQSAQVVRKPSESLHKVL